MAGIYKRRSDEARGKAGKFTCWWTGTDGKKKTCVGTPDRKESERIANDLDYQSRQVRLGLVDPTEKHRRDASRRPIADHLEDYRLDHLARENDNKHIYNTISALRRLFEDASIESIADILPDRIQAALGRLKAKPRAARTCNHALKATKGFVRWLVNSGRMKDYPAGLQAIEPYPQKSDRKRVRRPLSLDDLARLLEAAESGPDFVTKWASRHGKPVHTMSGPDRAMAYRVAMATGFRANEVRTLTPERFSLEGDSPTITVKAAYSKRGKRTGRDDIQPIRRDFACVLGEWLKGKPPGVPVFRLAVDRNAKILAADCVAAGIKPVDSSGLVIDFHALRHSYITNLVVAGINPKIVQKLARHSSITLTLDTYTSVDDSEMRAAIEGARTTSAPSGDGRRQPEGDR